MQPIIDNYSSDSEKEANLVANCYKRPVIVKGGRTYYPFNCRYQDQIPMFVELINGNHFVVPAPLEKFPQIEHMHLHHKFEAGNSWIEKHNSKNQ